MNEQKSRQGEGYDLYDYRELAFPAAGVVEAPYMVGYEQNILIQGAWPSESLIYPLTTALNAPLAPGAVVIPIVNTAPFIGLPVGTPLILMDQVNSQFVILALPVLAGAVNVTVAAPGAFVAYPLVNIPVLLGPTHLPVDAQNTLFYADVACNIRLVSRALAARQALFAINPANPGGLPLGVPAQITIPAVTWITLPDKWYVLYAVAVGAAAGTLIIKTSG